MMRYMGGWLFRRWGWLSPELNKPVCFVILNFYLRLQNNQRDILWMSYHECLPTRVFLKKRDLCASDICPRDGCGASETVNHLFWSCFYVKEVRERLNPFCQELFGVRFITWEIMMHGLYSLNKITIRALWLFLACLKEVLWDVRNVLFLKKKKSQNKDVFVNS
ncbi:hypothetical protein XELAEV_18034141mg [Xenopus laevis]|uniref:Reverse transcriptase zinc-binding domain-containing protein n=1 Tax=Xenopus laevis TaxID=8355 RepID=A0A974HF08_XENLA|nr:hypothetical protein XELAEV_18034141mg [Xenopus laevis]